MNTTAPPLQPTIEPLLSMSDIAAVIGVAKRTLQTWLAGGHLPQADVRVGKTRRWRRETILNWIAHQEQLRTA